MPVPTRTQQPKNIWIAAGDGDLPRVQELIEHQSVSPNAPDAHTYTPMHAAASYGQLEVLRFLVTHGGDVNVTDEDGDTPLYTVEDVATAQFLVANGATVDRTNHEGISPASHLAEDFPAVAQYLLSLSSPSESSPAPPAPVSQHAQEVASDRLTDALLAQGTEIMRRAHAEGRDPHDELVQAVSAAVMGGVAAGRALDADADADAAPGPDESAAKRSRTDEP